MVCSVTLTSAVLPMAAVADDYDTKIEQQNEIINGLKTQESEAATKLAAIESDMLTTATKIDELTAKRKNLKQKSQNYMAKFLI